MMEWNNIEKDVPSRDKISRAVEQANLFISVSYKLHSPLAKAIYLNQVIVFLVDLVLVWAHKRCYRCHSGRRTVRDGRRTVRDVRFS